jgi:hypothetical protein
VEMLVKYPTNRRRPKRVASGDRSSVMVGRQRAWRRRESLVMKYAGSGNGSVVE